MATTDRLRSLRTVLSREGWATVLVLAGAGLLVTPPDRAGFVLLGWTFGALAVSFVAVVLGSWVRARFRG